MNRTGIFLFFLAALFFSTASSATITCSFSESVGDSKMETEFDLNLSPDGHGALDFSSLPGAKTRGDIKIENGIGTVRVLDSGLNRYFSASSKMGTGSRSRFLIVPPQTTPNIVEVDCVDSAEAPTIDAKGLNCVLKEKSSEAKFENPFKAPIARNGHDIFELPQGKLTDTRGWVLGYQPLLVLFMTSPNHNTSVTSMGLLNGPVSLTWFPTPQNIQVELSCDAISLTQVL